MRHFIAGESVEYNLAMPRLARRHAGLLWFALALAACSSPAYAHISPTRTAGVSTPLFTPVPTLTAAPASTPTPAPALLSTLAPTLAPTVCAERKGIVIADKLDSELLNYPIELQVYLPPCYEDREGESYPVLYLLHGQEMNEKTWGEIGAGATADSLINSGDIPPLLIVMPRERKDDRFGGALANDILPYVDSHYRTLADRDHRALGGMSRGAGWALQVGLQNPGLFSALGLHSLAIFYADETEVSGWLNKLPTDLTPRFYIDIGDNDSLIVSADWLDQALTRRNIAHNYHLNPGSHTRPYWAKHLPDYLRWYTANW